ncbi:MAG: NADH-quinone oxidoreductase subunit NuoK [Elusimicrobiota bacterium]
MVTIYHYLVLSCILFAIGVFGALTRRNILGILISLELIFNAANINLIAFSHYLPSSEIVGQIFAIFVIAVAAAEAVVGLALVLALYRNTKEVFAEKMNIMKG